MMGWLFLTKALTRYLRISLVDAHITRTAITVIGFIVLVYSILKTQ